MDDALEPECCKYCADARETGGCESGLYRHIDVVQVPWAPCAPRNRRVSSRPRAD